MAFQLFGKPLSADAITPRAEGTIGPIITPAPKPALDEFGLPAIPRLGAQQTQNLNAGLGIATAAPPTVTPQAVTTVEDEKKVKRAKSAKSFMELAGVAWAAGSVWVGRKACEKLDKEQVSPNPKVVNDLAEVSKETFAEWFGDIDMKPWQLMVLMSFGIPLSMVLQARKKPGAAKPDLKAV